MVYGGTRKDAGQALAKVAMVGLMESQGISLRINIV
jgi:hypothetical protein